MSSPPGDAERLDVCVVGSANQDLVARVHRLPTPGETVLGTDLLVAAGGKGLNQAVAAARVGARTAFIGLVGRDAAGDELEAVLAGDGVATDGLGRHATATGRAFVVVAGDGENVVVVVPGANAELGARAVEAHAGAVRRAVVVLAQLEIPLDAVRSAFAAARRGGGTTVLNAAPACLVLPDDLFAVTDVLVVNEHEAALLVGPSTAGSERPATRAEVLRRLGPRAVVVTLGAAGAVAVDDEGEHRVDAFPIDAVDSTGAGDAFCGVLAARLAAGDRLVEALRWGAAAGAISATRPGAVPSLPARAEVLHLLSGAG